MSRRRPRPGRRPRSPGEPLVHRHGQGLGAAHPPRPAVSVTLPRREPPKCWRAASARSVRCPGGCPGCRCRSTKPRGHLPIHRQALALRPRKTSQVARTDGVRVGDEDPQPTGACGRRRPACPTGSAASRRRRGATRGRWHRTRPTTTRPGPCRRRRDGQDPRPPRDQVIREHPGRLLRPAPAGRLRAARRPDRAGAGRPVRARSRRITGNRSSAIACPEVERLPELQGGGAGGVGGTPISG